MLRSALSWMFFVGQIGVALWLANKAFEHSDSLDRYLLPGFGLIADQWTDSE
jgi:hypothetical protein